MANTVIDGVTQRHLKAVHQRLHGGETAFSSYTSPVLHQVSASTRVLRVSIQGFFEPWTMSLPVTGPTLSAFQMPVAARFHMRD